MLAQDTSNKIHAGRWMTPDPVGGDVTNPQSLNRYAYVLNNPTTLTDPSGLTPHFPIKVLDPSTCDNIACTGSGPFSGGGDGTAIFGNDIFDAVGGSAGYSLFNTPTGFGFGFDPNSAALSRFAWSFSGSLYGKSYNGMFATWDQYADWPTTIASLPESQIYAVFAAICNNRGCDPSKLFAASYVFSNLVYNVTCAQCGSPVDTNNLAGYWPDPFTFMHNGDPSWYDAFFFDTTHLIGSNPISGHVDPFGAFNPLHYLVQFPSMLLPAGGNHPAKCSLSGGCTLGP